MGSKNTKKQVKDYGYFESKLANNNLNHQEKSSQVGTTLVLLSLNHAEMALAPFNVDKRNS